MTDIARTVSEGWQRLNNQDPSLRCIVLYGERHTDAELSRLMDQLLVYPDIVVGLSLFKNRLTDKTGVELARYVAASTTIQVLPLYGNRFGEATYLAMAAVLHTNTSLQRLGLHGNEAVDKSRVDEAFVQALRLNPVRPVDSCWHLYESGLSNDDFKRLQQQADELGHPSMQVVLACCVVQF